MDDQLPGEVPSGEDQPESPRPPIAATFVVKLVFREDWSRAKINEVPTNEELATLLVSAIEAERAFVVTAYPERTD